MVHNSLWKFRFLSFPPSILFSLCTVVKYAVKEGELFFLLHPSFQALCCLERKSRGGKIYYIDCGWIARRRRLLCFMARVTQGNDIPELSHGMGGAGAGKKSDVGRADLSRILSPSIPARDR